MEARNTNFRDIVKNLKFKNFYSDKLDILHQFDYLFWFGDLNYRLEHDRDSVLKLIESKDYEQLFKYDQLQKEIREDHAFSGFLESPIKFPPTYRYNRGNRSYSTEKNRTPSYCDRILSYVALPETLQTESYNSCDTITTRFQNKKKRGCNCF